MNIYQIEQELLNIFEEIEDNEGDLTPELEEKLTITQDNFKDKIKSYANVIKMLNSDISNIKDEIVRLKDLQKSKEKTIERIKEVVINAIDKFGDTTKSGGKFIDYGIGKVQVRNTQAIEVDEDTVNRFVNRYITALKWYDINNQLQFGLVTPNELLDYANSKAPDEEDDDITKLSLSDLTNLKANIDTQISLEDLFRSDKGFNLAKALVENGMFNVKAKADKNAIKAEAKETNNLPTYAKLVNNKTVTIK